jgi:ABC-2 type transport system permease protein
MNNNKYLALARREFWEHRSLWMTPLVAAGFLLVAGIFGAIHVDRDMSFTAPPEMSGELIRHFGGFSLLGVTIFLGIFATMVVFGYLLDSLYAERKDRSILFWKSLPVSDTETVLSKLVVALVVVPLLTLVVALLLQPLMAVIAWVRYEQIRPVISGQLLLGSITALPQMLGTLVFVMIWYAPIAAYLMLASVLAKRTPLMYAALPPVVLGIAEKLTLDTNHVSEFVRGRLFPWNSVRIDSVLSDGMGRMKTLDGPWWHLFQDPALWLGLAAAAGMLYIVIRLRRYRDDT